MCVDLEFLSLLQDLPQCKDLVYCGFTWPETTLIRTYPIIHEECQAFTQYDREDFICDVKETYSPIVGAVVRVSFRMDWANDAEVSFIGHAFLRPYLTDELVHAPYQLISSRFK